MQTPSSHRNRQPHGLICQRLTDPPDSEDPTSESARLIDLFGSAARLAGILGSAESVEAIRGIQDKRMEGPPEKARVIRPTSHFEPECVTTSCRNLNSSRWIWPRF
jgi:hypothetical protein